MEKIEFVHTNLIARNWKKLAEFYVTVFGCIPVYPERNISGSWVERLTQLKDVNIKGIHLKLPGYSNGPTLEIFEYSPSSTNTKNTNRINDFGFGHLAFHVEDVQEILEKILENGGWKYGEKVTAEVNGVGELTVIYTRDPEGNIVEIQHWEK